MKTLVLSLLISFSAISVSFAEEAQESDANTVCGIPVNGIDQAEKNETVLGMVKRLRDNRVWELADICTYGENEDQVAVVVHGRHGQFATIFK